MITFLFHTWKVWRSEKINKSNFTLCYCWGVAWAVVSGECLSWPRQPLSRMMLSCRRAPLDWDKSSGLHLSDGHSLTNSHTHTHCQMSVSLQDRETPFVTFALTRSKSRASLLWIDFVRLRSQSNSIRIGIEILLVAKTYICLSPPQMTISFIVYLDLFQLELIILFIYKYFTIYYLFKKKKNCEKNYYCDLLL